MQLLLLDIAMPLVPLFCKAPGRRAGFLCNTYLARFPEGATIARLLDQDHDAAEAANRESMEVFLMRTMPGWLQRIERRRASTRA